VRSHETLADIVAAVFRDRKDATQCGATNQHTTRRGGRVPVLVS
jgi:hypothetical protein